MFKIPKFVKLLAFLSSFQLNFLFQSNISSSEYNFDKTPDETMIKKLFKNMSLEDLKQLEEDIFLLGEKYGIKNWKQRFELFKKTLSILAPYIRDNLKIGANNYVSINNWFVILTLLGLKPVTAEELLTNFEKFKPYLDKLSKTPNIQENFKYEIYKKFDPRFKQEYLMIRMVCKPLITISKITEWYNKDLGEFSSGQKFFELPTSLDDDEYAVAFFGDVNNLLLESTIKDFQDFHLNFLMNWAKRFEEFSDHPKNQAAIMLGYQPYTYNRSGTIDRWKIFESNINNYRFLLTNEMIYLDDPTPYLRISGKIMEYLYRIVFGNAIYSYILTSKLFNFIKEEYNEQPKNIPAIKKFLAPLLEEDIEKINVNKITLKQMATFIRNFLKSQSKPESKKASE